MTSAASAFNLGRNPTVQVLRFTHLSPSRGIRSLVAAATLASASLASHAGLILALTHDGSNGVIASVSGSGTISDANLPISEPRNRLLIDDIGPGSPFNANLNFVGFSLANPLAFAPGIQITGLIPDDDGGPALDDFFINLSGNLGPQALAFHASGSAQVVGLKFSDLTVGSYSNASFPVAAELGGFTLVIQDVHTVPEPGSAALAALALAVAGSQLRRRR